MLCWGWNLELRVWYGRQTFCPLSLSPSNRGSIGKSWFSSMPPMFYTSWWESFFLGLHFWVSVPFLHWEMWQLAPEGPILVPCKVATLPSAPSHLKSLWFLSLGINHMTGSYCIQVTLPGMGFSWSWGSVGMASTGIQATITGRRLLLRKAQPGLARGRAELTCSCSAWHQTI